MLLYLLLLTSYSNCLEILTLNGKWLLQDEKNNITNLPVNVPGGIYSDLMENGIISDIYYGNNDVNTKWVTKTNWIYSRNFLIQDDILNYGNINIIFEGLDTFSSIYINNQLIGKSENMFIQYIFDIKKYIKSGINIITIKFLSPVEVALNLSTIQEKNYTIPPICPSTETNGECHINMIRKMQASFSWDFGPSFPSVGIWKNVYIEAYNESVIRYIVSDVTEKDEDHWNVNLDIYLANNNNNKVTGNIELKFQLEFVTLYKTIKVNGIINEYNEIIISTKIEIYKSYVNVWWPNGYGSSDLYNLTVIFKNNNNTDISYKTIRIGFRLIELVQDELDSGLTFYFKVNKVPIFMKGSNQIPIDILPERGQNITKIKNLLTAAKDSHMNMFRVWGGGVYESDYFYNLADEYGILIWQDFMFACAMYPSTNTYIKNVLAEIQHQVKRLYNHASIALFAGNNENELALKQNWYNTQSNYTIFLNDYIKLYIDTIKPELLRITNNKGIFLTSSPSNGKESENEGYISKNPGNTLYGDIHYYNYILDPFNSNLYPIPRFASEYGYQSLPSVQSFLTVTNNLTDLNIASTFMNHRQHHPLGNIELKALLGLYFKLPNTDEGFIYYTQIVQALAIKIETEHYRRYRSIFNDKGEGYTMGALYWQLNDIWIAPTWSGIDHLGKWKMLQYYSQNFFAPIIITGHINIERNLEIYLVSDLLSPLENLTANIEVYQWKNFTPIITDTININIDTGSSNCIKSIQVDNYLSENGCGTIQTSKSNCFFYLTLEIDGVKIAPDNFVFPNTIKNSNINEAVVKINSVNKISDDDNIFKIEIVSDNIALFCWLDSTVVEGRFSENGFMLVKSVKNVYFTADREIKASELMETMTITHLLDKKIF